MTTPGWRRPEVARTTPAAGLRYAMAVEMEDCRERAASAAGDLAAIAAAEPSAWSALLARSVAAGRGRDLARLAACALLVRLSP